MVDASNQRYKMVQWHQIFGSGLTAGFLEMGVNVLTDLPVMSKPPEADVVLVRRHSAEWTSEQRERLPDGIRDTHTAHHLLELKYTESVVRDSFAQLSSYDFFYRQTHRLSDAEVSLWLLSAKKPEILPAYSYTMTDKPGVYRSSYPLCSRMVVLVLNELEPTPYNAYFQCFASRPQVKRRAFEVLQATLATRSEHPSNVAYVAFLTKLWSVVFQEKGDLRMEAELTLEEFNEMGEKWFEMMLKKSPKEKVFSHYLPEERMMGLSTEERLKGLPAEERLKGLPAEELLKGLPAEERLKGLPAEELLRGLPAEELLKRLTLAELEAYLLKLKNVGNGNSS